MHRTHAEPSNNPAFVPRLFSRKQSAKMSLTAWLKGHAYQDTDSEENEWLGVSYMVVVGILYEGLERRKREDMEVVEVTLELP